MSGRCADFLPDWKDAWKEEVRASAARPTAELAKLARGHTRIGETGTALDQGLFVEVARGFGYDDRVARDGDAGNTQPCRFRFTVAYPEFESRTADERAAAADMLAVLECGLDAVGKTNARFTVKRLDVSPVSSLTPPNAARGRWRVLLETDAVLIDPDAAEPPGNVERALREYFAEILDDGATLVDWYVQRRLVGRYLGMRRRAGSAGYAPWSVFVAGSCFLIEAKPGRSTSVAAKLGVLLVSGMPVYQRTPAGLVKIDDWRHCPLMPENGFGEISIDDPVFAVTGATAGGVK